MGCVARHLDAHDLHALVRALFMDAGRGFDRVDRNTYLSVPCDMRRHWALKNILQDFNAFLRTLADRALFHARSLTSVVAVVDWSPFCGARMVPVAHFRWHQQMPRVTVDPGAIEAHALSCLRRRVAGARVTLHNHLFWSGESIFSPIPFHATCYLVFPHFVADT